MCDVAGDEIFSPLTHQVAGCHSGTPSNILINKKGQILKPYKPISNPTYDSDLDVASIENYQDLVPVTLNELQFYTKREKSKEKDLIAMRKLSPSFYGSRVINGTDHVILEDFTYGMKYPCVMDLKIGKDRYYPGRTAEKAKLDVIKYPCLQEFGFCIAGIKMYKPSTGEVDFHYMPKITRKFSSEEVAEHVKMFLHFDEKFNGNVLHQKMIEGGDRILNWALTQRSIMLRGSSVLFVYDAAGLKESQEDNRLEDQEDNGLLRTRVGMIDFAHVYYAFKKEDANYIEGLKNLIHVLKTGKLPR